ncbi:FtsX-like permease family protein [Amedibacillus sp. YH-ame10]
MGVLKRAWISVLQRKVNSIILLVIVFILANVLLTTLSVNTSIKSTKDSVLSQLSPTVSIDYNQDIWSEENVKIPPLTADMATKLYDRTKDIVKTFDYSQSTGLTAPKEFKEAEILTKEQLEKLQGGFSSGTSMSGNGIVLSMIGTQLSVKPEESGEGKLLNGKGFSQSDIEKGNFKVLIPKQFAETNGLEVGSKMILTSEIFNTKDFEEVMPENGEVKPAKILNYEFEVAGIIEITKLEEFLKKAQSGDISKLADEYFQLSWMTNQLYAPNAAINKINEETMAAHNEINPEQAEENGESSNAFVGYVQPQFILKDMKYLKDFQEEALDIFPEKSYSILSASDAYDVAAKPLKTMGGMLDTIFIVTVVASIVILALVLCIFMYLRQKEMGIFLALGERKTKIIGQLLAETLIVALIGASLAIFTSIIFSNMLADNAMQSLLAPSDDMIGGFISSSSSSPNITPEMISQQYSGGFAVSTILIFYGTMFATIIVAQFTTVLYLLRLSPKKILM